MILSLMSLLQILFMGMMTEYYHYFFTTLVSASSKNVFHTLFHKQPLQGQNAAIVMEILFIFLKFL